MAKAGNKQLGRAKKAREDEFYTQLSDIERELRHYVHHFKGKTILCNCDDPRISNFFHYFSYKFEDLGLKRLITTCYKNQDRDLFSQNNCEQAIWLEYTGDKNGNRVPDPEEIGIKPLKGDGDFRSEECIELLKQADIVVTNPPFSLFRDYVAQLIKYDNKFLIIGHQNAIHYKEIFPLIRDNKIWLGYGFHGGAAHFINEHYEDYATASDHKEGMIRVSGVTWFTNLEIPKRNEELVLYREALKELDKQYNKLKREKATVSIDDFLGEVKVVNNVNVLITKTNNLETDVLKDLSDRLGDKLGNCVVFIANVLENKVVFVCKNKTKALAAGNLVKLAASITLGGGGGRPDFAQAGGKDVTKVDEALQMVKDSIK